MYTCTLVRIVGVVNLISLAVVYRTVRNRMQYTYRR